MGCQFLYVLRVGVKAGDTNHRRFGLRDTFDGCTERLTPRLAWYSGCGHIPRCHESVEAPAWRHLGQLRKTLNIACLPQGLAHSIGNDQPSEPDE